MIPQGISQLGWPCHKDVRRPYFYFNSHAHGTSFTAQENKLKYKYLKAGLDVPVSNVTTIITLLLNCLVIVPTVCGSLFEQVIIWLCTRLAKRVFSSFELSNFLTFVTNSRFAFRTTVSINLKQQGIFRRSSVKNGVRTNRRKIGKVV